MVVVHFAQAGLLACLIALTAAQSSESFEIATTSSNFPPFSLFCRIHYLCTDPFVNLVSVQPLTVVVTLPNGSAGQCQPVERSNISLQAEAFLNDCARGGRHTDSLILKSDCIAKAVRGSKGIVQADIQVSVAYSCLSAAITATTPVHNVAGDGAVSTWNQQLDRHHVSLDGAVITSTLQLGGQWSSQTAVAATAAAVVIGLVACILAGVVLVCWRRGLVCFAVRNASPRRMAAPPSDGERISAAEHELAGRLYHASTTAEQQQPQHGLPTAGNQHPNIGANAPSPPALLRYISLTEQEDHFYEAVPRTEDSPVLSNDETVIYDEAAISSSPVNPSHFLRARNSAGFDTALALPHGGDSNLYSTLDPPARSETSGVYSHAP